MSTAPPDAPPAPDPTATPPAADPPAPTPPPAPEPAKLTAEQQAAVDQAIKDRLARQKTSDRAAWEAELKQLAEREQMDAAERARAEKADAEKATAEVTSKATKRIVAADAKVALLSEGVDPKQIAAAVKLADLDGLDPDADDYDAQVAAAAKKVITDLPALKATRTSGGPSGGEFTPDPNAKVWTKAEVAKLSVAEFDKHEAEITKQMQTIGLK